MNKYLFILLVCFGISNPIFAQMPPGQRPPQDTHEYMGLFDVTPNENEVDYNTHIFSPLGNEAAFIGSLEDFVFSLNASMSKKTKKYFEEKKEWVILSFVVEKDSTVSDVQVWLSDDPVFSDVQHIWSLTPEIEDYPGWGKVFIAGRCYQIWKSRNKGINRDFIRFITQTRWTPITINDKIVRSRRNFHLPINLKRS